MIHNKRFKSGRMQDALYNLPKAIGKFRNPTLAAIENIEDVSDDLQGEGTKLLEHQTLLIFTLDLKYY